VIPISTRPCPRCGYATRHKQWPNRSACSDAERQKARTAFTPHVVEAWGRAGGAGGHTALARRTAVADRRPVCSGQAAGSTRGIRHATG
jgi:hypothetical protein